MVATLCRAALSNAYIATTARPGSTEFEDAVLADGALATEPVQYLVHYSPMPDKPSYTFEQTGAYESELGSSRRSPGTTSRLAAR
jgi:hypothetical protein